MSMFPNAKTTEIGDTSVASSLIGRRQEVFCEPR